MTKKEPRCANSKTPEVVPSILLALAPVALHTEVGDDEAKSFR